MQCEEDSVWVNCSETVAATPPPKSEIQQGEEFQSRHAKVRFYADENFPELATEILRSMGARVMTVQEANLRRHPDENHAAYALRNGYVLVTCDRDYLDNRRFPLVHCPALAVFDFGGGTPREIRAAFRCLHTMFRVPQFYDKWIKIDASRGTWTESARFLNGTTSRTRYRFHQGQIQEWIDRI
jgi:predicted nuclease of predicted toxin-antitoxin system